MSAPIEESLDGVEFRDDCQSKSPAAGIDFDMDSVLSKLNSGELVFQEEGIKAIENLFSSRTNLQLMNKIRSIAMENFEGLLKDYKNSNKTIQRPSLNRNIRYGYLLLVYHILLNDQTVGKETAPFDVARFIDYFGDRMLLKCFRDSDERVRTIAVEILILIGTMKGPEFYIHIKGDLLGEVSDRFFYSGIIIDLEKNLEDILAVWEAEYCARNEGAENVRVIVQCISLLKKFCMMFKTETIDGDCMDEKIVAIALAALTHCHYSVREAGYQLCCTVVTSSKMGEDLALGFLIVGRMVEGLTDLTSVVRMACCSSLNVLLQGLTKKQRESYFPIVIPPLCLSRYYTGDTKFMLMSQKLWRDLMDNNGILYVTRYLEYVVEYYVKCLECINKAVRGAATSCIGELATKIAKDDVKPYVPKLINSLEIVIRNGDWDDSDGAILALGCLVVAHGEECRSFVDEVFDGLLMRLGSPASLARQGVSSTLSRIVSTYAGNYVKRTMHFLVENLKAMRVSNRSQTKEVADVATSTSKLNLAESPAERNVKLNNWEFCDGAIYLIGDLASVKIFETNLGILIPILFDMTENRSYKEHVIIFETICKIIPLLYVGLGKSKFKEHLENFLGIIFYVIEMKNFSSPSGFECLDALAKLVGPNILKGRVQMFNPRFLQYCKGFAPT